MKYLTLTLILLINKLHSQCVDISPNNRVDLTCSPNGRYFVASDPELALDQSCLCCDPDSGDHPDACSVNTTYNSINGEISCSHNYDCCMCETINCDSCKVVSCNGDESCMGVKPININGSILAGGASLNCDGDVSCFDTVINGEYINNILCGGDWSCAKSKMDLNILNYGNNLPGLLLSFNGDKSCYDCEINANNVISIVTSGDNALENSILNANCKSTSYDKGCLIDIGGDNAAQAIVIPRLGVYGAIWKVMNASGLAINGDEGAKNTKFIIQFIPYGGPIFINGDNGAENSIWKIMNAQSLVINGESSARSSNFFISFVDYGGSVSIGLPNSARYVNWTLINVGSFMCNDNHGCSGSYFDIKFIQNKDHNIVFNGVKNAKDTVANIVGNSGLTCNGNGACENSQFNVTCSSKDISQDINGCNIECDNTHSCLLTKWNINNVKNIVCRGSRSCSLAKWNINCINEGCIISCMGGCSLSEYTIINSNGIKCGEIIVSSNGTILEGSCEQSTFNLIHDNITNACTIDCIGHRACMKSIFKNNNNLININGINCRGALSCFDTTILATCVDQINGCKLLCEGDNSCGVSFDTNHVIKLEYSNGVTCINGCNNRLFKILPAIDMNEFEIFCGECNSSIFDINGVYINDIFYINSIQCNSMSACVNTIFKLTPNVITTNINVGSIHCAGLRSCMNSYLLVNLNNFDDKLVVNYQCFGHQSCVNTLMDIKLNGLLLSENDILSKLNNGSLVINIFCSNERHCTNATINKVIDFYSLNIPMLSNDEQQQSFLTKKMKIILIITILVSVICIIIGIIIAYKIFKQEKLKGQQTQSELNENVSNCKLQHSVIEDENEVSCSNDNENELDTK